MDVRDIVGLGARQLNEKRLRTALSIIMVVIGVASIVALTSLTAGVAQIVQGALNSLGPTTILIIPSGKTLLTSTDVANLATLQNVSSVTPVIIGSATLTVNGQNQSISIVGVTNEGLQQLFNSNITLYQGSIYPDALTPDAVAGHSVAFSSPTNPNLQTVAVGNTGLLTITSAGQHGTLTTSKIAVPISGILPSHGVSLIPIDTSLVVSLPFAEELLHKTSYSEIMVKANSVQNVTALTSLIEVVYGNNARVENTQQIAAAFSTAVGSITVLLVIIGGVSLLVAAIGIMNVMLMSVYERIHDIGILKSVGFRSRDVMLIFLFQAVVIGALGGIIGLATGAGVSYTLAFAGSLSSGSSSGSTTTAPGNGTLAVGSGTGAADSKGSAARGGGPAVFSSSSSGSSGFNLQPVFTLPIIIESIMVAIIVSVIAGLYPAWKASKMEPIDALRTL